MKKHFVLLLLLATLAFRATAQDTASAKPKQYLGILFLPPKYMDEKNWGAAEQKTVGEHFQRLVRLKNEGVIILAGRTQLETNDPNMMGLVIFNARNDAEAAAIMNEDPAVKAGLMLAKVFPYGVAVSKCQ